MMNVLSTFFTRYWIAVAVITFALLSVYTSNPTFGQAATPTPDVNTVPKPEEIVTPTNTPFPSPTPADDNEIPSGGGAPSVDPTATRAPDTDSADDSEDSNPLPPGTAITGTVATVTLDVRRAPNPGANIVDTLFQGDSVEILGRDHGGSWWYICCGAGAGRAGWVSAQSITLANADAAAAIPVTANSSAPSVINSDMLTSTTALTLPLVLEMRPSPAFVWQGQTVQLHFVIHNQSDQTLTNVSLRDDLPSTLQYQTTTAGNQGEVVTDGAVAEGEIFSISWPEINAGERLTATVTLQVATNVSNGALIDNLAVVSTDEGAEALAGITFAMPPMRPPLFR